MITRRFEYTGGGSDKFWEVTYPDAPEDRNTVTWTCRWGRRGTTGQEKTFNAGSAFAARMEAQRKIDEKCGKGYVEMVQVAPPQARRPLIMIQPTIVAYARPRRSKTQKQVAAESTAMAEAAVRLAQSSGISVSEAMSLIERATQSQVNAANFPAALAAVTKAAKPLPHSPRTRKITLE